MSGLGRGCRKSAASGNSPAPYSTFRTEARRLYTVMEKRLGEVEYLAGDDYTIADIATWPWISRFEWQGIDLAQFPNVRRWYLTIAGRPGVQRGYDVPKKGHEIPLA
jgi:GSH-dependent disulfide-bond oxidoreductase